MDVHGECPDLLRPASAYQGHGGALWVVPDPCGTVIATVGWRPLEGGVIELERLYVHRRWRRQGLAAMLADLVERAAVQREATRIELWTDTRFADAHHFYERHGYVRHGPDRELGDLSRTWEHHYLKEVRSPGADPPGSQ